MKICNICRKPFTAGEKLAVVSLPVTCTFDGGDYSFLDDFTKNENILHLACLLNFIPSLSKILEGKQTLEVSSDNKESGFETKILDTKNDHLYRELYEALKALDEDVTLVSCRVFANRYRDIGLEDLMRTWFENRNKVS